MRRRKKNIVLHPIMTFVILILITIVVSEVFGLLEISTNFNYINAANGALTTSNVSVVPMLNFTGIKTIFKTTVSNFASFAPLSMLLITLIGIGIMDKSGFLESFFILLTRKSKKFTISFSISLITILASIMGDISFVIFIPVVALFFKYSKRNPKAGIIMAFAGLSCGSGINIFMSSIESNLLTYTNLAAQSLDNAYNIHTFNYLFVMLVLSILASLIIAYITEYVIVPKLGKYELADEEEPNVYLDIKKKRGLLFSLTIAVLYLVIFIYNIIPGLPLSGNLLDYSQNLYIDKLFGFNSFFNQGFVFIITLLFFICGLFYGIGAKTIKNNQDVSNYLGHSLDTIGKTIVLVFFASTFISIFKDTNMATVLAALIANFIASLNVTGIPLIFITFILVAIVSFFLPSQISSWQILSGAIVPVFMNAGLTPEFAELVFKGGASITYGITPLMAYFVVYLAFMDSYSEEDKPINLKSCLSYIMPYALAVAVLWLTVLIVAYIIGLPIGIGTYPVL